jgi:hypothetical protein
MLSTEGEFIATASAPGLLWFRPRCFSSSRNPSDVDVLSLAYRRNQVLRVHVNLHTGDVQLRCVEI